MDPYDEKNDGAHSSGRDPERRIPEAARTQHEPAALALRVPGNRINAIVAGERGITADTALRLGRYFGTSPQFWINMQARYDLESAKDKMAARIEREVRPRERAA
jgi:addiction module HigA family antidote